MNLSLPMRCDLLNIARFDASTGGCREQVELQTLSSHVRYSTVYTIGGPSKHIFAYKYIFNANDLNRSFSIQVVAILHSPIRQGHDYQDHAW